MEPIQQTIANNLKEIRERRRLSLDAVSKLSGVSKSMLGQIERGEVNPTVTIVERIAEGFHLSFADLTMVQQPVFELVDTEQVLPVYECKKNVRFYPLHTQSGSKRMETFYCEIEPKTVYAVEPQPTGTMNYLMVSKGSAMVSLSSGERLKLSAGMSMKFAADAPHTIENSGAKISRLFVIVAAE